MAVYDDIRAALEVHLANTPGIPQIAWENVKFEPTTGTPYVKTRLLHTSRRPAVRGLNPQMRYQGTFQVFVCYPEGSGPSDVQNMANTIIDRFNTGDDLTSNGVAVTIEWSGIVGSYNDGPWFITPVNVHWFSYNF